MNTHLTELTFILDRSGSMASLAGAAVEGFNHFLREHQSAPGLARLTLVLFDDEYLVPARSLPVAEMLPLDERGYAPRNTTALLDAIGRAVDELGPASRRFRSPSARAKSSSRSSPTAWKTPPSIIHGGRSRAGSDIRRRSMDGTSSSSARIRTRLRRLPSSTSRRRTPPLFARTAWG